MTDSPDIVALARDVRDKAKDYHPSSATHHLMMQAADALSASAEREKRLVEALKPFLGDETMEQLLWGNMPDSATGSVSVKLGDFRRARSALRDTP